MMDILTIEIADAVVIHCPFGECECRQAVIDDQVVIYVIL